MQNHVNELAVKEVTRKEFLAIAGIALSSVFGISTIIKLLNGKHPDYRTVKTGYGSSLYGGK